MSFRRRIDKLWYIHTMEYYSSVQETNDWSSQQLGWISKALCWVKEVKFKRWYSVCVYLPNPGIEPTSLAPPALAGGFFTAAPPGKPMHIILHDALEKTKQLPKAKDGEWWDYRQTAQGKFAKPWGCHDCEGGHRNTHVIKLPEL